MGALNDELEAGPIHTNVSSTPIRSGIKVGAKSSDGFGTKPSEGEHASTERAEEINVGKASSVPNVSGGVEIGTISKKKEERVRE